MPVIGCDIPVRVGGADTLGAKAGVWVKTHFRQEGQYLVATTYLVAAGSPAVFELRINLAPLEKVAERIHLSMHEKMKGTTVGFSFKKAWKSIKKTAKKIGKSKLVQAVGKVTTSIVKSKITGGLISALAVVLPPVGAPALAAYASANSALSAIGQGKQLVQTAMQAKNIIAAGNKAVGSLVNKAANRAAPPAAPKVLPSQVREAFTAKANTVLNAKHNAAVRANKEAAAKAKAARDAKKALAAKAALAKTSATTKAQIVKANPAVQKALAVKSRLAQPAVRAKLTVIKKQADSAAKALKAVAYNAQNATGAKKVDAMRSKAILNLVAQNQARLTAIAQKNAGGLPGLLIDKQGRITRGRFAITAVAPTALSSELLYTGPGKMERGRFSRVAGARMDELTVGWDAIGEPSRVANDIIGASRPPPRPRDRGRDAVFTQWLAQQQQQGKLRARVGENIGACISYPGNGSRLRVSGTAPGLIGCDCGSEF